jgi:arylsulfatase A-like enzyme
VREGNWKLLVHRKSGQTELFNLENDFRETRDLSSVNPEKVKYLMNLMDEIQKEDR